MLVGLYALPRTSSKKSRRRDQRRQILNHLYKRRYEDSQHLHFTETVCSAKDFTEDVVHIKESGKVKVANAILQSLQDFSKPRFPKEWKMAVATPLFKKGSTEDPGNYKLIFIIPIIFKLSEIPVFNSFYEFIVFHDLFIS